MLCIYSTVSPHLAVVLKYWELYLAGLNIES